MYTAELNTRSGLCVWAEKTGDLKVRLCISAEETRLHSKDDVFFDLDECRTLIALLQEKIRQIEMFEEV